MAHYVNLELSLSQYEDPWVLKKRLTDSDVCIKSQLCLPKQLMEQFIVPEMGNDLVQKLAPGVEVKVRDVDRINHSYTVTLKLRKDGQYLFGKGWNLLKNSKGLIKGDFIGLYWDKLEGEFKFKHLKTQMPSSSSSSGKGETSTQGNEGETNTQV
ncbi:PREDICTED: B3 domain-containing protein At1g10455-like [Camelina sativa]|uniref:B3 domain-containing protein At1g10455-like n=1 Tax=Camelina sativa TaxID=90675 RepID=A0ABM0X4B3_CAMSA|nr:PREDICTED: B3 domain-containing protein At1g10455-like [Camelina sativa]